MRIPSYSDGVGMRIPTYSFSPSIVNLFGKLFASAKTGILIASMWGVMRIQYRHIVLTISCLTAIIGLFLNPMAYSSFAADAASESEFSASADEIRLFEMINAARKDPLGVAESLGMDREKILKDFPELEEILINGLPELAFDDRLYQSATGHCREMLDKGYYAYESIDGRTVDDRMKDAGYVPAVSGESLGLLYFNNFVNSKKAVYQLFKNIYKDELDPEWTGQRNILNQEVKDIGVSVIAGRYDLNGLPGNVYITTCDFGSEIRQEELELTAMINQARTKPGMVLEYYGIDVTKAIGDFPDLEDILLNGVPPVSVNSQLYNAAEGHVQDMLTNGYNSPKSLDGRTPEMRIRDEGYEPIWSEETRALLSTCYVELSPQDAVRHIFKRMLIKALGTQATPDQAMFSQNARETGIGIASGESAELGNICGDHVYLAVADYAAPENPVSPEVIGIIFNDENKNGIFDPGEGIPLAPVEVKEVGSTNIRKITTNPAGGFSVSLPSGRYRVSAKSANNKQVNKWITVDSVNTWLAVDLGLGADQTKNQ